MIVQIGAYHSHPYWNLPPDLAESLRTAHPGVEWIHDRNATGEGIEAAEVCFGWHLPADRLERAARLAWMHSPATGVRRLLYPEFRDGPVRLTNSRGVHAPFMAEQVFAWLLGEVRRSDRLAAAQDRKEWDQAALLREAPPETLIGRRMLVVGFGTTGRELALRARGFGIEVTGIRSAAGDADPETGVAIRGPDAVDGFLAESEIVVNLLPGTPATRNFFDRARIGRMRPGAFFANVGRGATVDEGALAEALEKGRLGGAGLDVFADEPLPASSRLWSAPGVRITPHVAGVGHPLLWPRLVELFSDNLSRYREGRSLRNPVDKQRGY